MNGKDNVYAHKLLNTVEGPEETAEQTAFGKWLTRKLHVVFDGVAQEPLPDELLDLVRSLEAKNDAATSPK